MSRVGWITAAAVTVIFVLVLLWLTRPVRTPRVSPTIETVEKVQAKVAAQKDPVTTGAPYDASEEAGIDQRVYYANDAEADNEADIDLSAPTVDEPDNGTAGVTTPNGMTANPEVMSGDAEPSVSGFILEPSGKVKVLGGSSANRETNIEAVTGDNR